MMAAARTDRQPRRRARCFLLSSVLAGLLVLGAGSAWAQSSAEGEPPTSDSGAPDSSEQEPSSADEPAQASSADDVEPTKEPTPPPADEGPDSEVLPSDVAEPSTPMHDEEIVVTATRFDTALGNVPASVMVVSGKDVKTRPATNVDDLLRSQAAIDGQRYQGMGNAYPHILSIRGIRGPDRLLVMLDGQPINNALNGFPNLNLLPLDRVGRIELVRGPFSALYGSRAMAGVINVITEQGSRDPGLRLQSAIGPYGSYLLGGSAADVHGPVEYMLTYDRRQSDNYLGNSSQPNVDYEHHRLHARIDLFRARAFSATMTGGFFRSDMGFNQYVDLRSTPGLEFWLRNEGRSAMNDEWGQLALSWKPAPPVEVQMIGSILRHGQRFYVTPVLLEGEFPAGYVPDPELVTSNALAYRAEALARWFATHWLSVVLGGDAVRDDGQWRTSDLDDGLLKTGMEARATTAAGFAQLEGAFLDNRLRVIGGARVDHHSTFGTAVSPKVGISAEPHPGTILRAGFGRAFRSPSLSELYQPAWQRIPPYQTVGNEKLHPEILYAVDAGVEQRIESLMTARVTGFYSYGRDMITLLLQSDNKEHYVNLDRIRTAGVEVETTIDVGKYVRVSPNYVFTYTQNAGNGEPLDYVPAHLGGLSLMGHLPAGKTRIEAAFDMRVVGNREYGKARDPAVRDELSSYALGNARLQWVWPLVTFYADAYNLWDARYDENEGIQAPRFSFLAGVRLDGRWPWQ